MGNSHYLSTWCLDVSNHLLLVTVSSKSQCLLLLHVSLRKLARVSKINTGRCVFAATDSKRSTIRLVEPMRRSAVSKFKSSGDHAVPLCPAQRKVSVALSQTRFLKARGNLKPVTPDVRLNSSSCCPRGEQEEGAVRRHGQMLEKTTITTEFLHFILKLAVLFLSLGDATTRLLYLQKHFCPRDTIIF